MKSIFLIIVVGLLSGCSVAVVTDAELSGDIARCEALNGTLRGHRISQGPHMGKWRNSSMYCDFNTPPATRKTNERSSDSNNYTEFN